MGHTSDLLPEIVLMHRVQRAEQVVGRGVVTTVCEVNASHEPNHSPAVAAVKSGGVQGHGLLVVCEQRAPPRLGAEE